MKCEWAEGQLSAYLDDALDSRDQSALRQHLAACRHCADLLADYQRLDRLLADLPRQAPSPALRDRIFSSPEYLALLGGAPDLAAPDPAAPDVRAPVAAAPDAPRAAARPAVPRAPRRLSPVWQRALLPAAAVLLLGLAGGVVAHSTVLAPAGGSTLPGISTIGNPGQSDIPLAAGPRVVYAAGGALWSAAETGPGQAQRLTPRGIRVGAWSISPNGHQVAYADVASGTITVVRSDGLSQAVVASATGVTRLLWSPDAEQLAYIATGQAGHADLRLINSDGTNNRTIATGSVGHPIWSADSLSLAYTLASGATQGIWAYDTGSGQATEVSAQADPADPAARVAQLDWLPDPAVPALTWSAGRQDGSMGGIFTAQVVGGGGARRISPAGVSLSAAAYSAGSTGGAWLAASGAQLYAINAQGAYSTVGAGSAISAIAWAPQGTAAAVLTSQSLAIWTPAAGLGTPIASAAGTVAPAWSADGQALAFVSGGGIALAHVTSGEWASSGTLARISDAHALAWAPDDQAIAVASPAGVELLATTGSARSVGNQPALGAALAWTVAG